MRSNCIDTLRIVLPILVVVFGVGAVLLAGDHRRMIFRWGVGLIIATLVLGFGIAFGRDLYLDALPESASQPANAAAFDIVVRFLRNSNRIVFLVGLIMALGAWLAGPSRAATFLRSRTSGALEGVGEQAGTGGAFAGVARFVARYVNVFRVGGAVLAFVILIWMDHPDATAVLWLLLALLVYLAVIVIVARMGRSDTATRGRRTAARGLAGEGREPEALAYFGAAQRGQVLRRLPARRDLREQRFGDVGDLHGGRLHSRDQLDVGLGDARDLAHELSGGGLDLLACRGWFQASKFGDVPTHVRQSRFPLVEQMFGGYALAHDLGGRPSPATDVRFGGPG